MVSFGGGPLQAELVALAEQLEVPFTPHGWVEDWFDHFAENSVVILPSHREGLGNVLIEAAARGVPSVGGVHGARGRRRHHPGRHRRAGARSIDPESIADAVERAAELDVHGVDAWLERFSADSSGALLEATIDYAQARRAA